MFDVLRPLVERIESLATLARASPHFEWGIITSTVPLQVRLDGDPDPLLGTPSSLVTGLLVNDRVRVEIQNRRATIVGRGGTKPWVPLSYEPGFSAGTATQLRYRIHNGDLRVRGGATGTFTAGNYTQVTGSPIPAAIMARVNTPGDTADRHRGGCMGAAMRPCGWELSPDGHLLLGSNGLSAMPAWIQVSISIPLD